jgi:K+-transporting ATPase KdpF subunit
VTADNVIGLVIAVAVSAYLLVALIAPDRF